MKESEIYALIGRVLSGEADRHDHQLLQRWLEETEENRAIYKNLQQIWYETRLKEEFSNVDRVYHKFLEKREGGQEKRMVQIHQRKAKRRRIASVAAVILLIGGLSYWGLQNKVVPAVQPESIALVVKENPAGQKSKIVLADGTLVWLNSESTLRYPPNFSDTLRRIELVGEAYFQVAKEAHRPFVVASGGLQTTAVGTAFNVRHYAEDSVAIVFLAEGKVKIEHTENSGAFVLLEPGWGVRSEVGSAHLQKFTDRSDQWTGWKEGVLFFGNASIQEVVKTCERWYGVAFTIKGLPPQDWKFTGMFENENLENVLESMRYGKDFDYSIQDKQVELRFKN